MSGAAHSAVQDENYQPVFVGGYPDEARGAVHPVPHPAGGPAAGALAGAGAARAGFPKAPLRRLPTVLGLTPAYVKGW